MMSGAAFFIAPGCAIGCQMNWALSFFNWSILLMVMRFQAGTPTVMVLISV